MSPSLVRTEEFLGPAVAAVPRRYVRIPLAAACTGYTVAAIESKIKTGVWRQGHEYIRAPDNCLLVDLEGYERWAAGQRH